MSSIRTPARTIRSPRNQSPGIPKAEATCSRAKNRKCEWTTAPFSGSWLGRVGHQVFGGSVRIARPDRSLHRLQSPFACRLQQERDRVSGSESSSSKSNSHRPPREPIALVASQSRGCEPVSVGVGVEVPLCEAHVAHARVARLAHSDFGLLVVSVGDHEHLEAFVRLAESAGRERERRSSARRCVGRMTVTSGSGSSKASAYSGSRRAASSRRRFSASPPAIMRSAGEISSSSRAASASTRVARSSRRWCSVSKRLSSARASRFRVREITLARTRGRARPARGSRPRPASPRPRLRRPRRRGRSRSRC